MSKLIDEEDFDSSKMFKYSDDELKKEKEASVAKWKEMIDSNTAPGLVDEAGMSNKPSMYHKGKLDSGAVANLTDEGIEKAIPRYQKNKFIQATKNYKLVPKKR